MMNNLLERWQSVEEIAQYLGVNKDSIRNWIKKNNMPAHKIGKLWKFKVEEVDAWVMSGQAADNSFKGEI